MAIAPPFQGGFCGFESRDLHSNPNKKGVHMLSLFERMSLVNQYEILKKLNPTEIDSYEEWIEALKEGFTVYYPEPKNFFRETEMSEKDQKFVSNLLAFYDRIEFFKEKNPEDIEIKNHPYATFRGFDWNEPEELIYKSLAEYLLKTGFKRVQKKAGDLNTHSPRLGIYRQMIKKWEDLKGYQKDPLDRKAILETLNASHDYGNEIPISWPDTRK
jgi:uncharacterized protein